MARRCDLSGRGPASGNRVSHSNRKTKRRFLPNLVEQRFWSQKQNRFVRVRVTTRVLRTIKKLGFDRAVERVQAR